MNIWILIWMGCHLQLRDVPCEYWWSNLFINFRGTKILMLIPPTCNRDIITTKIRDFLPVQPGRQGWRGSVFRRKCFDRWQLWKVRGEDFWNFLHRNHTAYHFVLRNYNLEPIFLLNIFHAFGVQRGTHFFSIWIPTLHHHSHVSARTFRVPWWLHGFFLPSRPGHRDNYIWRVQLKRPSGRPGKMSWDQRSRIIRSMWWNLLWKIILEHHLSMQSWNWIQSQKRCQYSWKWKMKNLQTRNGKFILLKIPWALRHCRIWMVRRVVRLPLLWLRRLPSSIST